MIRLEFVHQEIDYLQQQNITHLRIVIVMKKKEKRKGFEYKKHSENALIRLEIVHQEIDSFVSL